MVLETLTWPALSELDRFDQSILMTPDSIGFLFVAEVGSENLWSWSLSVVSPYQSWLYLINLSIMTPDSIGILVVAWVALRICGLGSSHAALCISVGCT